MMRIDYARKTRDDAKLHEILQQVCSRLVVAWLDNACGL